MKTIRLTWEVEGGGAWDGQGRLLWGGDLFCKLSLKYNIHAKICAHPKCTAWWISAEWTCVVTPLRARNSALPTPCWGNIWAETCMLPRWLCKALGSEYCQKWEQVRSQEEHGMFEGQKEGQFVPVCWCSTAIFELCVCNMTPSSGLERKHHLDLDCPSSVSWALAFPK